MGEDANGDEFERELRDLLLTAFADGEEVTGEWRLETVPDAIPDWRVTVERTDATARASEAARRSKTD